MRCRKNVTMFVDMLLDVVLRSAVWMGLGMRGRACVYFLFIRLLAPAHRAFGYRTPKEN